MNTLLTLIRRTFLTLPCLAVLTTSAASPAQGPPDSIRFATYNVSFYRDQANQLAGELTRGPDSSQPRKIAEVIQRVRPDVLLLNEFDYDAQGKALEGFQTNYLGVSQGGQTPLEYPFTFIAPVNTGVDTGLDVNADGQKGSADDCFGYGKYPGQYGMAILSRYPITTEQIRTFQKFRWQEMPGNLLPKRPGSDQAFYAEDVAKAFRLSSKSHWDVPIQIGDHTIHFLVAHPTPPVFDGPEDRNGRRNHDEIRMLADYVTPGKADYLVDDRGRRGGLPSEAMFVIAGDMNADPQDGDSRDRAARLLTDHPRINHSLTPKSPGGTHFARQQGGINEQHLGPASQDTGDFGDARVGNLRLDYCLPSKSLNIQDAGIFWPLPNQPGSQAVGATDHRMVWIDVSVN